jgi:hypothetical protein
MNTKKHATELHEEHVIWLNKMSFYKDELKVMNSRLEEIAAKNSSKEVLSQVEHFQNQFIVQNENIDVIKHSVNEHESFIQREITLAPTANQHQLFADSPQIREKVDTFEKNFNQLRQEYNKFLSKHM